MEKDGDKLAKALKESGIKKKVVADLVGRSHNTMTNWLKADSIRTDILVKISEKTRIDLSRYFPERKDQLPTFRNIPGSYPVPEADFLITERDLEHLKEQVSLLKDLVKSKDTIIESQKKELEALRS